MTPTVSIIIPIYNAEATLARCLQSVLPQSLREIELENNRFLLDAIKTYMKSVVQDTLLTLPEITQETIDLAVESWGNEILYDFIKATGLLDVKCKSRYKLIPKLVDQLRKQQNRPSGSAGETTISVGNLQE